MKEEEYEEMSQMDFFCYSINDYTNDSFIY